ncbi:7946_t:CDS:2 [Entrophospora sp. SA101]|nr:15293_t:CDS:2 [Entrophospora sp. SA101]CAJ0829127.1 7946_t:CDS:2 [Entrophospora sp. SA101]CAJ0919110.1 487_t:CDS:2 [Entrophospora sp. SA101]
MARDNNLDQFYTNPLTAKKLTSIFAEEVKKLGHQKINFIEPSAGTGNFYQAIREINKNSQSAKIANPDYKMNRHVTGKSVYRFKNPPIINLEDRDFPLAALELKTKQLEQEIKAIENNPTNYFL